MTYRQKVSALFEVNMVMAPSTMASVRTSRTKRCLTSRSPPQQPSLPAPHWWRRGNPRLHLQKRENQSSSRASFQFDERRRLSLSIMKTRLVSLSPRRLLTACSHQGGRLMHELQVVAPPRVVARGSSVASASLPPIASVHTMMCLESS